MKVSQVLMSSLLVLATTWPAAAGERIDRPSLVRRHNPMVRKPDPLSTLSLGNGSFAFGVDVTGLQSFPEHYTKGIPLCTESYWGWHTFANPEHYSLDQCFVDFDTHGRAVPYLTAMNTKAGQWLRSNPHRLGLGRVGLELTKADRSPAGMQDITQIDQTLDLWTGVMTSRFVVDDAPVQVMTCCHPDQDIMSVRIESPLLTARRLAVTIAFPYGSGEFGKEAGDWSGPERHQTTIAGQSENRVDLRRVLDADGYFVTVACVPGGQFESTSPHHYRLAPSGAGDAIDFVVAFSPKPVAADLPGGDRCRSASEQHWNRFWTEGGAIDLSGSKDPRAGELERRIVLSQYLLAIQSAGPMPPPETGLTFNSWYGKPHLECHWWQGVQFALWNRLPLLERSLPWYRSIMPAARGTAVKQGYEGIRWPKMVGPDGREGPSLIAPLLIWQQPHPIYYAELCYRAHPDRDTLEQHKDMVQQSAEFMASFAVWDESRTRYVLGPPVMPAQENYDARKICNPTYELAYWHWGLSTAQKWRERLGMAREPKWDHVLAHLSKLPTQDGLYLNAESVLDTWSNSKNWRDHPSLLAAWGVLPGELADLETMQSTLAAVMEKWNWGTCWGWDFPMVAMTAARIGKPDVAIDALMMNTPRNHYLQNGHNFLHDGLPVYLTGNGSLLAAAAMMAGGWDGAPERNAPGFPQDGNWSVRSENLRPMP